MFENWLPSMKTLPIGFHTAPFELFFKKEPDYATVSAKCEVLDLISAMNNTSICVMDFYKHEYTYMSKNHLFLCGYSDEERKVLGEKLAEIVIYEEDKMIQANMKDAAILFFSSLDMERIKNFSLFTTHRLIQKDGTVFLVSNQYKPFMYDDNRNIWLVICITTFSTKNHELDTYIEIDEFDERYVYNPKENTFVKTKSKKLSAKEQEILVLSSQGYTSKEIAAEKGISLSTVKFHKQNILLKFNVQNISESCLYAFNHNLF